MSGSDVTTPSPSRTPDWLLPGELAMCPCGCIGKRKKGSFIEKTLTAGATLLRQVMFSEDTAGRHGLLQRIDPRVKLVGLLILLVAFGLVHSVAVLVAGYLATLLLAAASALPVGFFVRRVWLFVPIFTGIVVLPATLSIVTPGDVVLPLWTWHGQPQGFTAQGLTTAALVVTRVATSISLVVLVTLTTPWVRLLAALRAMGVPRIFVLVIGMAYRYIFLLLGSVTDMYEARKARTVGAQSHDKTARAFVGHRPEPCSGRRTSCRRRFTRPCSPGGTGGTRAACRPSRSPGSTSPRSPSSSSPRSLSTASTDYYAVERP